MYGACEYRKSPPQTKETKKIKGEFIFFSQNWKENLISASLSCNLSLWRDIARRVAPLVGFAVFLLACVQADFAVCANHLLFQCCKKNLRLCGYLKTKIPRKRTEIKVSISHRQQQPLLTKPAKRIARHAMNAEAPIIDSTVIGAVLSGNVAAVRRALRDGMSANGFVISPSPQGEQRVPLLHFATTVAGRRARCSVVCLCDCCSLCCLLILELEE